MISIIIYRRELEALNACPTGLGFFEWLCHEQGRHESVYFREWTPLHAVWLAANCPDAWWLVEKGLVPRASLDGASLYGASLYGASLDGANLYGANLYGANLDGANLDGANLTRANLTRANLTRAYCPFGELPLGWTRGTDGYLVRA